MLASKTVCDNIVYYMCVLQFYYLLLWMLKLFKAGRILIGCQFYFDFFQLKLIFIVIVIIVGVNRP